LSWTTKKKKKKLTYCWKTPVEKHKATEEATSDTKCEITPKTLSEPMNPYFTLHPFDWITVAFKMRNSRPIDIDGMLVKE